LRNGDDGVDGPAVEIDGFEGLGKMQGSGLAGGVDAVPIKNPEGGVAGLLDLGNEKTAAHRVDRAGGNVDAVAHLGMESVQALIGCLGVHVASEGVGVDSVLEAGVDDGVGGSVKDHPRFCLAGFPRRESSGLSVVGMDLHRQKLITVEQLDEEREVPLPASIVAKQLSAVGSTKIDKRPAL
jgi:hypothetical protein